VSQRRRPIVTFAIVAAVALASFGLGLLVATSGDAHVPPMLPSASAAPASPAVRILIDPDSVVLLPDASLRLDLPTPPDAGLSR
jgi:hypothetical protein